MGNRVSETDNSAVTVGIYADWQREVALVAALERLFYLARLGRIAARPWWNGESWATAMRPRRAR